MLGFTTRVLSVALLSTAVLLFATPTPAIDRLPSPLHFNEALEFALQHYPSIRVAVARISAAQGNVSLAQTAYLPRLDGGLGTMISSLRTAATNCDPALG